VQQHKRTRGPAKNVPYANRHQVYVKPAHQKEWKERLRNSGGFISKQPTARFPNVYSYAVPEANNNHADYAAAYFKTRIPMADASKVGRSTRQNVNDYNRQKKVEFAALPADKVVHKTTNVPSPEMRRTVNEIKKSADSVFHGARRKKDGTYDVASTEK
ncbi:hypothetical protein HK405_001332, partial [Cladochytrium tenue]